MKSFLDSDYDVRVSLNVHAYKLESRSRTTVFPPSPLKERKVFFTQLTMSRLNEVIFFKNFFHRTYKLHDRRAQFQNGSKDFLP